METFLQLNRAKLRPIFIRISFLLSGVVSIVLMIGYFTGNFPNGQLLFYIFLTTGVGFPILIMWLGYLGWLLSFKVRQKAFSMIPFNQIENIGFYKAFIDDTSKWALTEEIKEGKLNGFTLRLNISKEKGHRFLEFIIPVEWKKLDKSEYNHLTEKFKQHNAEFRIESLVKQYDTRQPAFQTVSSLKQDLEQFTTLLRQEGFKPKT